MDGPPKSLEGLEYGVTTYPEADILEKHSDERSAKKWMEQRRQYLNNS